MANEASSESGKINSLPTGTICFGPFRFDPTKFTLSRGDAQIRLPPRALGVLGHLVNRPGLPASEEELLVAVWADVQVTEDALTQAISLVRQALGDDPRDPSYIESVPGLGYRFIEEVSATSMAQAGESEDLQAGPPLPLVPGLELGNYRILSRIGAGAMGEVWRARDTQLGREVAIKIVPSELAEDDQVLERFRREARLLAQVNHPNIATIHAVEESGGLRLIVLEFIEGETLENLLGGGPLPVEQALRIGRQMADALEAAHEMGIIHRDLKPANIVLTHHQRVKVLDFGLAKEIMPADQEETIDQTRPTQAGVILGTVPYMSPEQVRGEAVDERTDIWAFGCVLFELLTGSGAFRQDTVAETLVAILDKGPDWTTLPETMPQAARRLLTRCLIKEPRDRLHHIADARLEIEDALASRGDSRALQTAGTGPANTGLSGRRTWPWWVAALAASMAAVSSVMLIVRPASTTDPMTRLAVTIPDGVELRYLGAPLTLSPDGRTLVYSGADTSGSHLFAYRLDTGETEVLRGTKGGFSPFFSPGGEWIAFAVRRPNELRKVPVDGGIPTFICEIGQTFFGGSWGSDDTIVFVSNPLRGLWSVQASGGEPVPLKGGGADFPEDKAEAHFWPSYLPDGRGVLFSAGELGRSEYAVYLLDLTSGQRRQLQDSLAYANPTYAHSGHILYASVAAGALRALPFDLGHKQVVGSAESVLDRVLTIPGVGVAGVYGIAANGTLAFAPTQQVGRRTLALAKRDQDISLLPFEPRMYNRLAVSPDGSRLLLTIHEDQRNVSLNATLGRISQAWIADLDTNS